MMAAVVMAVPTQALDLLTTLLLPIAT